VKAQLIRHDVLGSNIKHVNRALEFEDTLLFSEYSLDYIKQVYEHAKLKKVHTLKDVHLQKLDS